MMLLFTVLPKSHTDALHKLQSNFPVLHLYCDSLSNGTMHLYWKLKMKAVYFSETSYETAQCHNPEEYNTNLAYPENWNQVLLKFEARESTALNITPIWCVAN